MYIALNIHNICIVIYLADPHLLYSCIFWDNDNTINFVPNRHEYFCRI